MANGPSIEDAQRIAAMDDPVARNREITESYAEISAAMRPRIGDAADWCTFATWASRQAGSTIRGEDLLDLFERHLGRRSWLLAPLSSLSRLLLHQAFFQPHTALGHVMRAVHSPSNAFARASAAVAQGNRKVFAEIGVEFTRFLADVPVDATEDSAEFLAFAAGLAAGPPPRGQDLLREAFAHYQRLRREPDPAVRASWLLLANLKIGLHEQTRLQPQITAALDAPVTSAHALGDRVLGILVPGSRDLPSIIHGPCCVLVGMIAHQIRLEALAVTRDAITEKLLVLTLPNIVLRLGDDLVAPVPRDLAGVPRPFLASFVGKYDSCPPGGTTCAVKDWHDLPQRMHYIVHLFRAYAEDPSLFTPPFPSEEAARFQDEGRVHASL